MHLRPWLSLKWKLLTDVPKELFPDPISYWRARSMRTMMLMGGVGNFCAFVLTPPAMRYELGHILALVGVGLAVILSQLILRGPRTTAYIAWGLQVYLLGVFFALALLEPGQSLSYGILSLPGVVVFGAVLLGRSGVVLSVVCGVALMIWLWMVGRLGFGIAITMSNTLLLLGAALWLLEHVGRLLLAARAEAEGRADKLAELDRLKTEFYHNVSHEFRTPLTLSIGVIDELMADPATAAQREQLLQIARNNQRLLKMVGTLLDFASIATGQREPVLVPLDLGAVTRELCATFAQAMERAGLRFVVDCPSCADRVFVDPTMWEKIVLNLLSNALKFTLHGEVTVTLRQIAGEVTLAVQDTGVGISKEAQKKLFDRFYRVPGSRGRSHEGSGIGLALAWELVRLHGGRIQVASQPEVGSTFTVVLHPKCTHVPLGEAGGIEQERRPTTAGAYSAEVMSWVHGPTFGHGQGTAPAPAARDGQETVLIVDDNADMRTYLQRLLGGRYAVSLAADGAQALHMASAAIPDLVLSDIAMPGIDGLALVDALRKDARTRAVPVILLTARAGEENTIAGLRHGADDYLSKPFSSRELLARVDAHLALARLRKDLLATKDRIMKMIVHELRVPLTTVKGYMQMACERTGRGAADPTDLLRRAQPGLRRLELLINDLADVARIQTGQLQLHRRRSSLNELCLTATDEHELATEREIALSLPPEPVVAEIDPERMLQVFGNLLSNALKYSPQERNVEFSLSTEDRWAVIRVRDHGPGIPVGERVRIFDSFYQIVKRQGTTPGLGLGLFICKELVEGHGGRVEVEDAEGGGALFVVRLPLGTTGAPLPGDG